MLYAGANGSTAEEIARVMHWSVDEPHVHAALGAISSDLNARNGEQFDLAVANRLWGAVGFPFQQPFLDTLQSSYRAPLQTVDFWADPEAGRRRGTRSPICCHREASTETRGWFSPTPCT
jgi:serpin B